LPTGTQALIHHLEEKGKKEGTLPQLLQFYQKLLAVQLRVEQKLASRLEPGLSGEAISRRLERGAPLIDFDELSLDWQLLTDTFAQVVRVFADFAELFHAAPEKLKELKADLLTRETVRAWYEKNRLPAAVTPKGVRKNLLTAIINETLKPFLASHARALIESIDQERWRRNYCPICGGIPDFAFLDTDRGSKWLKCSRCDSEWIYQRLQCPFCGTEDQNVLNYFTDDEGRYRLYVCDRCHHYLKTIDLRQAKDEVLLPLERLYTLDIDRQAREQGYKPSHGAARVPRHAGKTTRANQG
jgi:FdhE protein